MRSLHDIAVKESMDELTDYTIYSELAKAESDHRLKSVFSRIAKMEKGHFLFWKKHSDGREVSQNSIKVGLVLLMRRLFGPSFIIKYLEGSEASAQKRYESLRSMIPKSDRKAFEGIIKDEEEHEQTFANEIQTGYVKYVSFVVLGLADALVEIAGIHAGSLGIYNSTFLTGLAGIVAGAAASIAMASAAFAQAKQGFSGSAKVAAGYTGVSYFIGAVILASPYFIIHDPIMAIISSLALGTAMVAFVSWYNSIMSGSNLTRDFLEIVGVMLGATMVLFILGFVIRHVFGLSI